MVASPSLPQSARRPGAGSAELALLRGHPVFGALEPEQLEQLVSYARTRRVPAGTTLFSKGDPGTELFAVSAGTVKISVPAPDGREAMFNLLHPGEIFGEIALLDGRPRTADAMAMTDCELTVIERRDFLAFVHGEPNVALQLIALLCERLRIASEHYEEVVFLDLPTRLARILLQLADQSEAGAEEPKLKITQREISQMLGLTRESVNKQLRTWAKRGLIALERGGIVVYRLAALAAIAGGVGKQDT
jgi:CRP/FNR family transcriptional regulator, cyclic AMP receptor protein